MGTVIDRTRLQYVYDYAKLDRVPDGPTSATVAPRRYLSGETLETAKSSTIGAGLIGAHIIMALVGQARGSGAKAHTHPNEQFNYILAGTMLADIEGNRIFARAQTLLHTPTAAVHTGVACPDEDLVFLAMKDTRHGVVGPPVDGKHDGPLYLPGFGKRAEERRLTTQETIAESARTLPPARKTYVYDIGTLDARPAGEISAALSLRAPMPNIAGGSAAFVSGDVLHVGLVRLDSAAQGRRHTHGSEQFDFVLSGALDVELDGVVYRVPERSAMHIPAGVPHRVVGCAAGTCFIVVKNKTYGIEPEWLD
jgi:quercetin dioxygenase-like cupin family protein